MADALMMALVVAIFAAAAVYVGWCDRLTRRPDLPDEDQR
jgi:hypothetical protein